MTEAPLGPRRTPRQRALALVALLLLLAVPLVAWDRMVRMPQASHQGPIPAATDEQIALARALRRDVEYLATTLGERNLRRHSVLERSANWIQSRLETAGYTARRQTFLVEGKPCHNLEVQITGTQHPDQIVVVGAHYDSAPGTPGANDNGSGVASLLALAGRLKGLQTARTVRLVFFTNEEPPHFQTPAMGSVRYASRSRQRGEQIVAMLSLETMGYFSERAGSQKYPGPLQPLYPDAGNFVAFVGDLGSRELVHRVVSAFRKQTPFPSEGAALPALLPGVSWSDHWSFWQQGYPALMVTDTAPFRYPHYHEPEDTPDKLDYQRLARVAEGLDQVVRSLARIHHQITRPRTTARLRSAFASVENTASIPSFTETAAKPITCTIITCLGDGCGLGMDSHH